MKQFYIVIAIFILFFPRISPAQNQSKIWYFGEHAGLDFTNGAPVALTDGSIRTREGCATICDENGKLLFYTDGISVWNRLHGQMPNGFDLDGNASTTQSAIIIPWPGNTNLYYIFTVDYQNGTKGVRYSLVDMSLQGKLGDITVKNIPLIAPTTEKITAVYHKNRTDIWVIVHERKTDIFYSYLVTSTGISLPVMSKTGTVHGQSGDVNNNCDQGYMKASPDGSHLAVAITGLNLFEVLDFDNATGLVSNPLTFPAQYDKAYGVEFSPDGTKLYGSSITRKELYQFDLKAGGPSDIIHSVITIPTWEAGNWGNDALQLGPDGKIYIAASLSYLGVIHHPNRKGLACSYQDSGAFLGGKTSLLGLPNFIQSYFNITAVTITYQAACIGTPTLFTVSPLSVIDSIQWNFNDPASGTNNISSELRPSHLFSASGTYEVHTLVYRSGMSELLTTTVVITPFPEVHLGNDTVLCEGSIYILHAPEGKEPYSYLWSTGETGPTLSVKGPGTYWVSVSNGLCIARDTIHIDYSHFVLTTPKDTSVCPGGSISLEAKGALFYHWSPSDGLNNTDIPNPIASPTKTTLYSVTGTDKNGCMQTASFTIAMRTPPHVNLGNDTTICKGDNIILNAEAPGLTYQWSTGERTSRILVNKEGDYWVHISDGHCEASDTIHITVEKIPLDLGDTVRVCNVTDYVLNAEAPGLTYLWSTGETTPRIHVHTTGNYWVKASNGKCETSDTVYVAFSSLSLSLWPDTLVVCTKEYVLNARGSRFSYQWSTGEITPNIRVSKTGMYWVKISNGICEAADSVYLIFPSLAITATSDTTICEGQSIQLSAMGAQYYHWTPITGLNNPDIPNPIAMPSKTTTYTVTGTDIHGCISEKAVTIAIEKIHEIDFRLPDTLAQPGDREFSIPLRIYLSDASFPIMLRSVQADIRINSDLFTPTGVTYGMYTSTLVKGEYILHLDIGSVLITQSGQTITEMKGVVLLNLNSSSSLQLSNAYVENCARIGALYSGSLTLDPNSICGGLSGRNVQSTDFTTIWSTPNPSQDDTHIHASIAEEGEYKIAVFDLQGQVLWKQNVHHTSSVTGRYEFIIPQTVLPAGVYQVVLYSRAGAQSFPLHIVR